MGDRTVISAGMLLRFLSIPAAMAMFIMAAQSAGGLVLRPTGPMPVVVSMR